MKHIQHSPGHGVSPNQPVADSQGKTGHKPPGPLLQLPQWQQADDGFGQSIPWRQMTSLPSGLQGESLPWSFGFKRYHVSRYTLTRRMSGRRYPPEKNERTYHELFPIHWVPSQEQIQVVFVLCCRLYSWRGSTVAELVDSSWSCHTMPASMLRRQLKRYSVKLQLQTGWDKNVTRKCWPVGRHFSADSV